MDAKTPAIDEWTLCENLGANMAETITNHYDTFIVRSPESERSLPELTLAPQTEEDFAMIAGAGLNWVRISIPYWAIEVYEGEPFLEGVAWTCTSLAPACQASGGADVASIV